MDLLDNTINTEELLKEYEEILLHQKKKFSCTYFSKAVEKQAQTNCLVVFKYFIEGIMKWTPEEAILYLNDKLARRFKLFDLFKYIAIPDSFHNEKYMYILSLLYPKAFKFDDRQITLKIYKDIINKNIKIPKNFFYGIKGRERACLCLSYVINSYFYVTSIEGLYKQFASPDIGAVLKKYSLFECYKQHFNSPLQFLHYSLSEAQQDIFLFNYYQFMINNEKTFKDYKKKYITNV